MALSRGEQGALAAAGVFALAMPAVLLWPYQAERRTATVRVAPPVAIRSPAPLSAAFARPIFAAGQTGEDRALPADAPELIGIAGRIGNDAVALVRAGDGNSRTLAVGEAVDGWTLESLAIDAAYFTRGNQRLRVPLPAGP